MVFFFFCHLNIIISNIYGHHLEPPPNSHEKGMVLSFASKKSQTKSLYNSSKLIRVVLIFTVYQCSFSMQPLFFPGPQEDSSASLRFWQGRSINCEQWSVNRRDMPRLRQGKPMQDSRALSFPFNSDRGNLVTRTKPQDRICWDHPSLLVRELLGELLNPLLPGEPLIHRVCWLPQHSLCYIVWHQLQSK